MTKRVKAFLLLLLVALAIMSPSLIACDNDINGFRCPEGQTIVQHNGYKACE